MRLTGLFGVCTTVAMMLGATTAALAQTSEPETRQSTLENAAAEKAKSLQPYEVTLAEKVITRVEARFIAKVADLAKRTAQLSIFYAPLA